MPFSKFSFNKYSNHAVSYATLSQLPVSDTVKAAAFEHLVKTSSIVDHLSEHKEKYIAGAGIAAITAAALADKEKKRQELLDRRIRNNNLYATGLGGVVGALTFKNNRALGALGVGATSGGLRYLTNNYYRDVPSDELPYSIRRKYRHLVD